MDNRDRAFKVLAERYAENLGKQYQSEHQQMMQQRVGYVTPRADAKVRQLRKQKKSNRPLVIILATAAAVAVIAVCIPTLLLPQFEYNYGNMPETGFEQDLLESYNQQDFAAPGTESPIVYRLIFPRTSSLPADLYVDEVKYDNGQSIYILRSFDYGDVVLTMEAPANNTDIDLQTMGKVIIDGKEVAAIFGSDSKLIAFSHNGILYTISSEQNEEILLLLYQQIVK